MTKVLGQKDNQISGTGLSQTNPQPSFLMFVVEDNCTWIFTVFLILHIVLHSVFD